MNKGIQNEIIIAKSLNNKKVYQLNNNLKEFIKYCFKIDNQEDLIECKKINSKGKADLMIKYNDQIKYISIKSGENNSIHSETLKSFTDFLKCININYKIILYLKLFHYGDDTFDGSGKIRYNVEDLKLKYRKEIAIFNRYVSHNNLLEKIITRFLFENSVDLIYYGNEKYGLWANKDEILNYLLKKKSFNIKTIHFSSLIYQCWSRNLSKNDKSEFRREYIQIKWHTIVSDLEKIKSNLLTNDKLNDSIYLPKSCTLDRSITVK